MVELRGRWILQIPNGLACRKLGYMFCNFTYNRSSQSHHCSAATFAMRLLKPRFFFAIRCLHLRGSFLSFLSETVYRLIKLAGAWIVYITRNKDAKSMKFLSCVVSIRNVKLLRYVIPYVSVQYAIIRIQSIDTQLFIAANLK